MRLFFALIVLCCLIEAALILSSLESLAFPRLRLLAFAYAGFWPGLLADWQPNYAAQPYAMFVTYGFLHSGPLHLAVNMITLWSLGRALLDRIGAGAFALLYFGSCIGGAVVFALLAPDLRPMLGASGALFGLAGALLAFARADRRAYREHQWPVVRAILLLGALNLVLWWAMGGQLAWQTHLGGFIAGWLLALPLYPGPQDDQARPMDT